jgi:hypothetical protein
MAQDQYLSKYFTILANPKILLFTPISRFSVPAGRNLFHLSSSWLFSRFVFTHNMGGILKVDTLSESIGLNLISLMVLPGLYHIYYYLAQMIGKFSSYLLKPQNG